MSPVDETLIRGLLADQPIEAIQNNLYFRSEVLNHPEGAEVLVRLTESEKEVTIVENARALLGQFDKSALQPVAVALARKDPLWRVEFLNILWTIMSNYERREQFDLLQGILSHLIPLLDDRGVIEVEHEEMIEIEYELRVCDETYLFIQEIYNPRYDEDDFLWADFEERDKEIRLLQNRFLIA